MSVKYAKTKRFSLIYDASNFKMSAVMEKANERKSQSILYFQELEKNLNGSSLKFFDNPQTTKYCLGISTKKRIGDTKYLVTTLAALLSRYSDKISILEAEKIARIVIFNHDMEPDQHFDAVEMSKFFKVINTKDDLGKCSDSEFNRRLLCDMTISMRVLKESGCEHVLLLEDDALASNNWLDHVNEIIDICSSGELKYRGWAMVKLFFQPNYLHWLTDLPRDVFLLFGFAALGGFLFCVLLCAVNYIQKNSRNSEYFSVLGACNERNEDMEIISVSSRVSKCILSLYFFMMKYRPHSIFTLIGCLWGIFFAVLVGKQNLVNLFPHGVHIAHYAEAAAVVNLYSPSGSERALHFFQKQLNETMTSGIDLMLTRNFFSSSNTQLVSSPSIFQHIGHISSRNFYERQPTHNDIGESFDFHDGNLPIVFKREKIEERIKGMI